MNGPVDVLPSRKTKDLIIIHLGFDQILQSIKSKISPFRSLASISRTDTALFNGYIMVELFVDMSLPSLFFGPDNSVHYVTGPVTDLAL